jgi:hypothetical protein
VAAATVGGNVRFLAQSRGRHRPAGLKYIVIWFAVGSLLGFMGRASK